MRDEAGGKRVWRALVSRVHVQLGDREPITLFDPEGRPTECWGVEFDGPGRLVYHDQPGMLPLLPTVRCWIEFDREPRSILAGPCAAPPSPPLGASGPGAEAL